MKLQLFTFLLLALSAGVRAAGPLSRPASTHAPGVTNKVLITCQAGAQVTTNHVIFRKNVQAQDSQMYLECELLTAWYSSKGTNAPKPAAAGSGIHTDSSDIDLIVAETNVMMITAEMQIIGDRAVYDAAEDKFFVTGQLVVALNAQGSFAGTNIVYNRRSGEISGDGPITTIFNGTLTRSNAPPPGPKPK
ncbi:MAG: hypothetical protein ACREUU_11670 [Gammaproteobacteria bacterium]